MSSAEKSSIAELLEEYDLASLLDPSLHEMEQKFQGLNLFKYYSNQRRGFFNNPTIRFTQKTSLNDRFELTKRWDEFGSTPVREYVTINIKRSLRAKLDDPDYVIDRILKEFSERGQILNSEQQALIVQKLMSPEGEAALSQLKSQANETVDPLANLFFDQLAMNSDDFIEEQVRELGIFSVSETATNEQLWALYANEGRGFVVSFNIKHSFFRTGKNGAMDWPLFHKVTYSDERIDDFWKNPLYLFAVKKKRWSFEEEWRMIKLQTDCDEIVSVAGEDIFLCKVEPGMIEAVIFGYAYDPANLKSDIDELAKFDPKIKFRKAVINQIQGCISIDPLHPII